MSRYTDGAFCFYRTSSQCQPMHPHDIEHIAARHGISAAIVPQYAGDRQQVSRAIAQVSGQMARKGWQITSIKTGRHEVVYGISAIDRDQQLERVDFAFTDRIRWSDEGGNGHSRANVYPGVELLRRRHPCHGGRCEIPEYVHPSG